MLTMTSMPPPAPPPGAALFADNLADNPAANPAANPIAPASGVLSWLSRLRPWHGALLLACAAAGLAAALALALTELFLPAGALAAPLAAATGMLVTVLPLAALLLKLARQAERQRAQLSPVHAGDTGAWLSGRAAFVALAEREWARARRYGGGIAMLVIEVDRLRKISDTRGAGAAETLLHEIARHTALTLRGGDALARLADGQMAVFLAHADATGTLDAAERIRERLEQLEVGWQGQPLRATVSVGAATLALVHPSVSALLDDAQLATLLARQAGGNCVRTPPIGAAHLQTPGSSVDDNQRAGPR